MANMFDKVIEDYLKINGGVEDETIKMLRALRSSAGDVDDATALRLIQAVLKDKTGGAPSEDSPVEFAPATPETPETSVAPVAASSNNADDEIVLSEENKLCLANTMDVIKEFLDGEGYHYSTRSTRSDLVHFDLGFNIDNASYKVKITAETDPNVCCITATIPIVADPLYVYPVCFELAKRNFDLRYGTFKYDERDGEITFEYSIRTQNGLEKDDLDVYFYAVVNSAKKHYSAIRKYCTGRLKGAKIDDILDKVKALANDLADNE